jgi:hypothetical protein
MNSLPRSVLLLTLALCAAPIAAQENGELGRMWTFETPPRDYLRKTYDFEAPDTWLNALRLASLRFGDGCSASFVSPRGLIMTNHHCVRDKIAEIAPPDNDWVEDGFFAPSLQDEPKIEGLTVQQLVAMHDVTERMREGIAEGDDPAAVRAARERNEKAILEQAEQEHAGLQAQVVMLHQGAVYRLYLYKVYDDVRLVVAPHLQAAHFGGDPDNFTFPRYCNDFAFCRAWDGDKPADTSAHHFRWKEGGAKDGELVFVTGNPGSTGRLLTHAQMQSLRDAEYPLTLDTIGGQLSVLRRFAERAPMLERLLRPDILNLENSVKAITGYYRGLLDDALMARKRQAETAFRARVAADPQLQAKFGHVWDELAQVAAAKTALEVRLQLQSPGYSPELRFGMALVAAVDPQSSEEERAKAREQLDETYDASPIYTALFIDHLARIERFLPADDPFRQAVLGDRDPVTAARRLARTRLRSKAATQRLLEGGEAAVAETEDPAIAAARVLAPLAAANRKAREELDAREARLGALIGQALFACYGDEVSPDATFTLRFSDGVVSGYPFNGTLAPYRTTFWGLFARNVEFDNQPPFHLPDAWLARRERIDLGKALDFVSTNDIIGGNSGSPVVNKDLEVVGLIFDGNIEQLPNRFVFAAAAGRSVSVHVDAILESLRKVYDADRVADELLGRAPSENGPQPGK